MISAPHPFLSGSPTSSTGRRKRRSSAAQPVSAAAEKVEIIVCVNRSCGRQGSREVLEALTGLAPPNVAVASCGCLGRCGAGPNLVVLPKGTTVSHFGTAARAAHLLSALCGPSFDPDRSLEALALRKKGEAELEGGNAAGAQTLLSQAIDLEPLGGLHFLYRNRSAARLAMGDNDGALGDAKESSRLAPNYPQGRCTLCHEDIDPVSLIPNLALRAAATAVKTEDDRSLFDNASLWKRRKEIGEQLDALKRKKERLVLMVTASGKRKGFNIHSQ